MPRLVQDRLLLEGFRAGSATALSTVYLCYAPGVAAVLRYGFSVVSSGGPSRFPGLRQAADLQDGVQEVFARAFAPEARARYDGLRPYGAYLAAIARNWALNELRRARPAELTQEIEETTGSVDALPPSPEREAEDRELERLLADFQGNLSPELQRLWELRFDQGLAQEAAALALGKSRIQLRRLESRLKVDLLSFLQRSGHLEGCAPTIWTALGRAGST